MQRSQQAGKQRRPRLKRAAASRATSLALVCRQLASARSLRDETNDSLFLLTCTFTCGTRTRDCRARQAWCVECDTAEGPVARLKLFFLDLQSVPRNHIRYISWIAYVVRRDPKSGLQCDSMPVENAPHSNYYLQDGMDLGTIMDTSVQVDEVSVAWRRPAECGPAPRGGPPPGCVGLNLRRLACSEAARRRRHARNWPI